MALERERGPGLRLRIGISGKEEGLRVWGGEGSIPIFDLGVQVVCVAQLCPNLCDHMDCSPPGSSVLGIFQARILEWGAISSSRWGRRCD